MKVDVVQFLRPNGREQVGQMELPDSAAAAYEKMIRDGCRFEAEILTTGAVSVTISNHERDLDISLTDNGPAIQEGMVKMLERYVQGS